MPSRGCQLSATVPTNIVSALSLEPGRTYTLQLQEGEEARLIEGSGMLDEDGRHLRPDLTPPDPAVVDREDADAVGTREARPIRLINKATAEIRPGQGPYYFAWWAWDPGAGWLVVNEL